MVLIRRKFRDAFNAFDLPQQIALPVDEYNRRVPEA